MKRTFLLLALCASVSGPIAALAQGAPPARSTPSPELRAMMEKEHADARVAAFGALTPAHVAGVNAIVTQVTGGTLDRRTAATQIDALLTPDEQRAVLAVAEKTMRDMRAAMMAAGVGGPGMGGPPPGAPPPPPPGAGPPPPGAAGQPPPGAPRGFGPRSAGRFLLMVSLPPGQMRYTEPRARSTSAP